MITSDFSAINLQQVKFAVIQKNFPTGRNNPTNEKLKAKLFWARRFKKLCQAMSWHQLLCHHFCQLGCFYLSLK